MAAGTGLAAFAPAYDSLLTLWFLLGAGYSLALTPSGRRLRRQAHPEDRPAIFAALLLAGITVIGIVVAMREWPRDVETLAHGHPDLPPDHPHLADHGRSERHWSARWMS